LLVVLAKTSNSIDPPASIRTQVLIVDDDASVRRAICRHLQSSGIGTIEAASGAEALRIIEETAPALVVLDAKLGDLTGFQLCRRLKEDQRTCFIPVLMVSGIFPGTEYRRDALRAGAFDYLTKPFNWTQLQSLVKKSLGEVEKHQKSGQQFKGTVLVADDDPEWLMLIRGWLEPDYRVFATDDEKKILELASAVRPDCLVLDFQLRTLTAADICRAMQADPRLKTVQIIVLTSLENEKLRSLKIGADRFVVKGSGPEELIATVEASINRRSINAGALIKGDVKLEPSRLTVFLDGVLLTQLSKQQFLLFQALVEVSPQGVSRDELYARILPKVDRSGSKALEKLLERLKDKVGPAIAGRILSIKGFGWLYR
jgi:DNA-binding response OmpR family regulator